jgi:hypothetical protein
MKMIKNVIKYIAGVRGVTTAEAAIVFPVFFVFTLAVILSFTAYAGRCMPGEESGEGFEEQIREVDNLKRKTGVIGVLFE